MFKFLFFIFCFLPCFGQKLHHQTIASQGATVLLATKMIVSQSIGQSSIIGNYKNNTLVVGQGYIQSFGMTKSISPPQELVSVLVYPNPVMDIANFKFSSNLDSFVTLTLFDSRGRLVYRQQLASIQNSLTVNLSSLSEGVYFVKLETLNHTFSTKILKSK